MIKNTNCAGCQVKVRLNLMASVAVTERDRAKHPSIAMIKSNAWTCPECNTHNHINLEK